MTRPAISVIGAGKVGIALARLASSAGYRVLAVAGRDLARAELAARQIGDKTRARTPVEAAREAQLVFLTVSDSSIEGVAQQLAESGVMRDGSVLVHCSGALTSQILAPVRRNGQVATASFHPLATFPSVEQAERSLPGSCCFLEGDPVALDLLENFGSAIGTQCVRIETHAKVLYHAGAVIACNYLCALMDAALRANEAAGIERQVAWPALQPLVRATLENIVELGPGSALTGPIQRGDHETVGLHMRALSESAPELVPLYRALGSWTLELAAGTEGLPRSSAEPLREVLIEGPKPSS